MLTLLIVFIVYLKRIPYVKSILDQYKTDQETIAYHWKTDKDLLVVKKLSVLNIIVIFFLYLTLVFLNKNIDISNINNIMECTEVY
jgi:hypothetical protein